MIIYCNECLTPFNNENGKIVLVGDKTNKNTVYETCFYCNSCIEMFEKKDITILKYEIETQKAES